MKLEAAEIKFLLKLLGCSGYGGKISALAPSAKTTAAERDRIGESLSNKGLVECDREIARFTLAPAGKTLLGLDTTSLPVTPDELKVLRACKGSMTPGALGSRVPAHSRQQLLASLAERGLIKVSKVTLKAARLTAQGKQFLRDEYEPSGHYSLGSATMVAHYLRFLRASLAQASAAQLAVGQAAPSKPDAEAILQCIQSLDRRLATHNYLPIYHVREALQPPLTREELDAHLYQLQREDRIELSSLHDQSDYSEAQLSAGIPQENQCYLFFISVL